ncbi:hypothetical protein M409DRAFT_67672 [Zasmidium cellare ATCC 36951]|uniref:Cytochrome P450 n=1 Tax=Zasmidium cellare ATCC 36951 TaxID=1080233 RepID=A0A6A6CD80_ZASCE|nr:uncharacterized protein M409DRAFT_67672 [Zasmidium cellare ATCC 36951]KAF2165001.1 hypothetical protein M409DRAFT_67672 [Zasmidium cellare ATCC 36951]
MYTLPGTVALITISAVVFYITSVLKTAFFGPLSHFPGPRHRALSKLPGIYTSIMGLEAVTRVALHERKQDDRPYKDPMFYVVGVNGCPDLSSADFGTHTKQRKILSQSFSDRSLRDLELIIRSWAEKMASKLSDKARTPIDMMTYLNCTTFDIMGDLTFGEDLKMLETGELSPWVRTIFGGFKAGSFWRGIRQLSVFTDWIVRKFLFESRKVRLMQRENFQYCSTRMDARLARTPYHPDLWSRISETEGGEGLSRDEYRSNSVLFMIAETNTSSETTATALCRMTYLLHLSKHGGILNDLKAEMHAVIQESLRIYPPVPPSTLPRKTQSGGVSICGHFVPGDVVVGVHPLATFHSPRHFKDPQEFHPERWLNDAKYQNDHLDAVEPFSVGPQNCLGKSLAYHEMRFLLASLILNFDIELINPAETWLDQRTHILWEKKPLMCKLRQVKG